MRSWIAPLMLLACFVTIGSAQDLTGRTIIARSVKPTPTGAVAQAYGLTREDFRVIKSLMPGLQSLVPIRRVPKQLVRVRDQSVVTTITGTTPAYVRGKNLEVVRGRFLADKDDAQRNNVAVIHSDHAKQLFANQDPLGKAIQFNNDFFTIVGVLETDDPASVFIPYRTMRSRLGDQLILRTSGRFEASTYELSEIEIVVTAKTDAFKAIETIKHILAKYHSKQDYEVELKP